MDIKVTVITALAKNQKISHYLKNHLRCFKKKTVADQLLKHLIKIIF